MASSSVPFAFHANLNAPIYLGTLLLVSVALSIIKCMFGPKCINLDVSLMWLSFSSMASLVSGALSYVFVRFNAVTVFLLSIWHLTFHYDYVCCYTQVFFMPLPLFFWNRWHACVFYLRFFITSSCACHKSPFRHCTTHEIAPLDFDFTFFEHYCTIIYACEHATYCSQHRGCAMIIAQFHKFFWVWVALIWQHAYSIFFKTRQHTFSCKSQCVLKYD